MMNADANETPPQLPVLWFSEIEPGYHNPESLYKIEALERAGHRVVVVHPIGGASLGLRNLAAAFGHLRRLLRRPRVTDEGDAISGLRLFIVPVRHGRFTSRFNNWLVARQLSAKLKQLGLERPVLWFRFPSPELVAQVGSIGEGLAVYDCIDYVANRPLGRRGSRATREAERELIRSADLVLGSSERLFERARPMAQFAAFHPHGVDTEAFAPRNETPPELDGLRRPIIGYTGGDDWVDVDLIATVADRHPEASVLIVGPWQNTRALRILSDRPNVRLLGPRPHGAIRSYMAALDVGLLPYRLCVETEYSAPVKVCEYLAVGIASVGTDVPYLRRFRDHMIVAADDEAFLRGVDDALKGLAPGSADSRRRAVEDESWNMKNARLLDLLREATARRATA